MMCADYCVVGLRLQGAVVGGRMEAMREGSACICGADHTDRVAISNGDIGSDAHLPPHPHS